MAEFEVLIEVGESKQLLQFEDKLGFSGNVPGNPGITTGSPSGPPPTGFAPIDRGGVVRGGIDDYNRRKRKRGRRAIPATPLDEYLASHESEQKARKRKVTQRQLTALLNTRALKTKAWERAVTNLAIRHFDRQHRVLSEKLNSQKMRKQFEVKVTNPYSRSAIQAEIARENFLNDLGGPAPEDQTEYDLEGDTPVASPGKLAGLDATAAAALVDRIFDREMWADQFEDDARGLLSGVVDDIGHDEAQQWGAPFTMDDPRAHHRLDAQINRMRTIEDTTGNELVKAFQKSPSKPGVEGLQEQVDDVFKRAKSERAPMIGQVETHAAANGAVMSAGEQGGISAKRWVTMGDDKVRPAHQDAEGQVVPLDQPYFVDGEELMYPGDPNGSPGNVINCRCISLLTNNPEMKGFFGGYQVKVRRDPHLVVFVKAYSDDEPRDDHGRWTSGGTSPGSTFKAKHDFKPSEAEGHHVGRAVKAPQFPHSVTKPVDFLAKGRAKWESDHGLSSEKTDWSKVNANPDLGKQIAADYQKLPSYDKSAEAAFKALAKEINDQYDYLTKPTSEGGLGVKVDVVDKDPYENVDQLAKDLRDNHHMSVLSTKSTGGHPFFSNEQNDKFRAVHDAFAHAGSGRGFDRNGEEAAFEVHSAMMRSNAARQALATETRGQNSTLIYGPDHDFPEQKVAVLPGGEWKAPGVKAARASETKDWAAFDAARSKGTVGRAVHERNVATLKAMRDQVKNGGWTIHPKTGDSPTTGYQVATVGQELTPRMSVQDFMDGSKTDETADRIGAWMNEQNKDTFDNPNMHIGGWVHEGHVYLEPSENIADRDQAIQAGRDRNQIAIWDNAEGDEILTGGTGEN